MFRRAVSAAVLCLAAACGPHAQQYPVEGQVIGVSADHRQLTIDHKDIPNFMPAMTMAYFVRDPHELDGIGAGDLATATLVVSGSEIYLKNIKKTGHADLPAAARPIKAMDVMAPGDTVPDDSLVDESGAPRRLSDWRGKALAVTFIYTRCPIPTFCPLMDRQFAAVQQAAAKDPSLRDRVHLVSITFDPAHDTPAVLKTHAAGLHADPHVWTFLTGTPEAMDHVTERFGISAVPEKDPGQTVTHNLRTAVIDPKGRVTTIYSGNEWTVDQMLDALKHALQS
ncbi:MAG TPA: SCO family protein [Vicinamibacterales bacterium]|jgi:protein SCO1/2|nr:SCO family protein [Vicinamibacterales bacterium]